MKDIELEFDSESFKPGTDVIGRIRVNFPGRYDGVVISSQILDSNELITYKEYNGKKISHNVARLFVSKDAMPDNTVEFAFAFEFDVKENMEVKFRASIIEQHKEIESAVVFGTLSST